MLAKEGYDNAITGTASYKLDVDANGYLIKAGSETAVAGYKRFAINNLNAANSADSNESIYHTFVCYLSGAKEFDETEGTFSVKWNQSAA